MSNQAPGADASASATLTETQTLRRALSYARPHMAALLLALPAFALAGYTDVLLTEGLKWLTTAGFGPASAMPPLYWVPLAIMGIFLMRGLGGFLGSYLVQWFTGKTVQSMREDAAGRLLLADARIFAKLTPSVIVTRLMGDSQVASMQLANALTVLLRDGTAAIFLLCKLLASQPKLTLMAFLILPILAGGLRFVRLRVRKVSDAAYQRSQHLVELTEDLARAWRVIRTFDAAQFERERFSEAARQTRLAQLKSAAAMAMMQPVSQLAASVGVSAIVVYALWLGQGGQMRSGEFFEYVTGLLLLVSRLRPLADVSQMLTLGNVSLRALLGLVDAPREPEGGAVRVTRVRGDIQAHGLTVRYDGQDAAALSGLDLHIQAGQTVALVGGSGAGKTTFLSALLGFATPSPLSLMLDGVPVEQIRLTDLRKQFAVVSQDIVLFDDSIARNVAYSQPMDEARVRACLEAAALWEFVQGLEQGIHTAVGPNGGRLSGGQRQRLAIARALYKDAPVWILDEATSALDSESEHQIQQTLRSWQGQRTLILVAHRLSTVRHADRIFVMQDGKVVEEGDHDALMAQGGTYAMLVNLQQVTGESTRD